MSEYVTSLNDQIPQDKIWIFDYRMVPEIIALVPAMANYNCINAISDSKYPIIFEKDLR